MDNLGTFGANLIVRRLFWCCSDSKSGLFFCRYSTWQHPHTQLSCWQWCGDSFGIRFQLLQHPNWATLERFGVGLQLGVKWSINALFFLNIITVSRQRRQCCLATFLNRKVLSNIWLSGYQKCVKESTTLWITQNTSLISLTSLCRYHELSGANKQVWGENCFKFLRVLCFHLSRSRVWTAAWREACPAASCWPGSTKTNTQKVEKASAKVSRRSNARLSNILCYWNITRIHRLFHPKGRPKVRPLGWNLQMNLRSNTRKI